MQRRRDIPYIPIPAKPAVTVAEPERRAIITVAGALVYRAGRTTLVMALRGSHAQRVRQFKADEQPGAGHFAGVPEPEVLARVDAVIAEGLLRIERSQDGFPLLGYTPAGLELAEQYAAENWLKLVRSRVAPVAGGTPLELPFLMRAMPDRNHDTVFRLIDLVAQEADASWLPLLRAWSAAETKRARAKLSPLLQRLEAAAAPG